MPSSFAPIRRRLRSVIALLALVAACAPASALAAQHMGDRTLHKGDRGQDVRVLQDFLTRAGYPTPVAGIFGPQTHKNVKRFQRAHGMAADGVVGSATNRALRTIAARKARAQSTDGGVDNSGPSEHLGDRTLKKGMRGQDVRVLQDYLTRAGVSTPVDGVFGPGTLKNVKRFQRSQGLTVDGVVGDGTEGTLRRVGEGGTANDDGGSSNAPVGKARLLSNGLAVAPADAPEAVKGIIAAGNRIATTPYRYGGGHGRWEDSGYDCSGSVSYALHGGGLIDTQLNSTGFMSWGSSGTGRWVTVYGNPGHAYMVVAGLRFDTSGASPSRWQSDMRSSSGYTARHPSGF